MADISEELGRLADLRDRGVLTHEEFDQQKAALLHPAAADTVTPAAVAAPAPSASIPTPPVAPVVTERPAKPRPPGYAPPTAGSRTTAFIIVGVVALIAILAVLWAMGALRSRGTSYGASTTSAVVDSNLSAPTAPPTAAATPLASSTAAPTPAAADDSWLMGQWENVATPGCAQWLRFGADHSLSDNASGSGSWSLAIGADGGYILSMNINGTGLRQGAIVRDAAAGTITMGSAPNSVTWRKTSC